ncbi:NAD(P)H-dependent oxidoreductase subunit E [Sporomusa acidovorans]|uniref:NADP-reducing hydrogenase subunit HndA n=1 Tax=Sporomusa acidovorans (strain ATCC 49682 / DSM 3132 / Mol) TaxID=1123286 RepID=A0ABZ3J2F2_SPOA4|nr:NAD(P)H-dependent oxidoreductase subunit E [Sporomusa acidovorans]OZC18081.1 NADP-reducing hydrogenase subunit HndA [Sporomusa acidovorans DSM 3132]SDF72752.1 NADH-quinone oxidoreductase subunit E [Sporomusa acidovorans]
MINDAGDKWEKLPEIDKQLINILNQVQAEKGFIPRSVLIELADKAGIPEAQLQGLVSFFNSFRTRPAGMHKISVCYGTACYAKGAPLLYDRLKTELNLDDYEDTSADGFVTVDQVYCVGACSRAPLVVADGEIKSKMQSFQVPFLLENLRKKT